MNTYAFPGSRVGPTWRFFKKLALPFLFGILSLTVLFSAGGVEAQSVYVTNTASQNVSVIDTATNTVVTTIPVGIQARGLAITPDGAQVYVVSDNADTVKVAC